MKKVAIFLLLFLPFFMACENILDIVYYLQNANLPDYYMEEWEELDSYRAIATWIQDHVSYTSDVFPHTQSPHETILRGKGDCEDIAILFMNIAKVALNIEMQLVIVESSRHIEDGGLVIFSHAMVRYNGVVIEAQTGYPQTVSVCYYYHYDEIFI